MTTYNLDFTSLEWEELIALSFEPFKFETGAELTRVQWVALAHLALGKAFRITRGDYNMGDDSDQNNDQWVNELIEIAGKIVAKFQPGDGQV